MEPILILVGHEPKLDPRIDWLARAVLQYSGKSVRVLGVTKAAHSDFRKLQLENIYSEEYVTPKLTSLRTLTALLSLLTFWDAMAFLAAGFIFFASLILISPAILFSLLSLFTILILPGGRARVRQVKTWIRRNKFIYSLLLTGQYIIKFSAISSALISRVGDSTEQVREIVATDLDTLIAGAWIKRRSGGRLIYDAHEFYPHQFGAQLKSFVWSFSWLERRLMLFVDEFLIVSPQLGTIMKEEYGWHKDPVFLPNCTPRTERFEKEGDREERDDIVFLFQGQFAEGRGLETLIRFWCHLNPVGAKLVLRGPDNGFKDACIKLAQDCENQKESIIFAPPVSEAELVSAAKEADVGIIPYEPISLNSKFCCPNKLSQYMQAGLVILANDLPYVRSVIERYDCGVWYNADSYESFEEVINRILYDANLRHYYQRNAQESFERDYNWNEMSKALIPIFGGPVS